MIPATRMVTYQIDVNDYDYDMAYEKAVKEIEDTVGVLEVRSTVGV